MHTSLLVLAAAMLLPACSKQEGTPPRPAHMTAQVAGVDLGFYSTEPDQYGVVCYARSPGPLTSIACVKVK